MVWVWWGNYTDLFWCGCWRNYSTIAAGSSNGLTGTRYCTYCRVFLMMGGDTIRNIENGFPEINKLCNVASCWKYIKRNIVHHVYFESPHTKGALRSSPQETPSSILSIARIIHFKSSTSNCHSQLSCSYTLRCVIYFIAGIKVHIMIDSIELVETSTCI
jgi:hypothetical protein